MSHPLFSLVVPTYNEAKNIIPLLESVHTVLFSIPHEIIVVDDNSPDSTWLIAEEFAKKNVWIKVIRRAQKGSLSSAVICGFEASRGEILGVIDADLSHDEKILPELINAINKGSDIAVGSRRISGGGADKWPLYRRITSTIATWFAKKLLDLELSDPMSGYFVLNRQLYESCKSRLALTGYKILLEIYCKAKPKDIHETAFIFKDRKQGHSKFSSTVAYQYILMVLMLKYDGFIQRIRYIYHTGRYKKVKKWLNGGNVLDVGCGKPCETMNDAEFLSFIGYGFGIDIKKCKSSYSTIQGNIMNLPITTQSCHNVVAMEVMEHVTDTHKALTELSRILKNGGNLIISVPDESWIWTKIWNLWEKSFGYMWEEKHIGTMNAKMWKKNISERFTIQGYQRHWYFDLIFCLGIIDTTKRP